MEYIFRRFFSNLSLIAISFCNILAVFRRIIWNEILILPGSGEKGELPKE
jgi:hypothetical protein